jgi:hypothetical protein
MTTLTNAVEAGGTRLADLPACPKCDEVLIGPKTSSYLGLGRIEHTWHCDACGIQFQTKARLAGMIEADPAEFAAQLARP